MEAILKCIDAGWLSWAFVCTTKPMHSVSETKNVDTLTLRKCHLYGFYVNVLHSMMCRTVTLRGGISAELLNTF